MRTLGYAPSQNRFGEKSFVRLLTGRPFPRFHIYVQEVEDTMLLDLHLDQKKPSYEGSRAHSGEHDGPLVENEIARIQNLVG
jgi:hypothetical protein